MTAITIIISALTAAAAIFAVMFFQDRKDAAQSYLAVLACKTAVQDYPDTPTEKSLRASVTAVQTI